VSAHARGRNEQDMDGGASSTNLVSGIEEGPDCRGSRRRDGLVQRKVNKGLQHLLVGSPPIQAHTHVSICK
jgi:hypothetical protein